MGFFSIAFYLFEATALKQNIQARRYNPQYAERIRMPSLPFTQNMIGATLGAGTPSISAEFDLNIPLQNPLIGRMKVYRPKKSVGVNESIAHYGGLFGFKNEPQESQNTMFIQEQDKSINVHKETGALYYRNQETVGKVYDSLLTEGTAAEFGVAFLAEHFLPTDCVQMVVERLPTRSAYYVSFINTIEGVKNYGYPKRMIIHEQGKVLALMLYDYTYEQVGLYPIRSMQEAYEQLQQEPIEMANRELMKDVPIIIDIKEAELVYYHFPTTEYEKAYLQPAYRFKGELPNGMGFEKFIPAIK